MYSQSYFVIIIPENSERTNFRMLYSIKDISNITGVSKATIQRVAHELNLKADTIKGQKQLFSAQKSFQIATQAVPNCSTDRFKALQSEADCEAECLNPQSERLNPTNERQNPPDSDSSKITIGLVETLSAQLKAKDYQIDELYHQINELHQEIAQLTKEHNITIQEMTKTINEITQSLQASQALHAGTMKKLKPDLEPSAENPTETIEAPAVEVQPQSTEEEKQEVQNQQGIQENPNERTWIQKFVGKIFGIKN